ncbi:hypothetical protein [Sphingopyxis sp. GW247-27LB]|uniref:hypothetical protein n=1 Tax=Sphingopyxis sp. GW247-27LB TaxID=2012632 RepID=UPI000BA64C89|nr:hypothetical protein [Sphingopyxis sp. GW247-27LB]PAL25498.1 hypothetical protein CD928_03220 [Sphingopyxis sp. GW247-27LB]
MRHSRIFNSAIFDEVAAVIGSGPATKLCDRFGGTILYVPRVAANNHEIAVVIGAELAQLLCDRFAGSDLLLPKAYHRRQRVIELLKEGKLSIRAIALATDYTERHVHNIKADSIEDDGQGNLLDLL